MTYIITFKQKQKHSRRKVIMENSKPHYFDSIEEALKHPCFILKNLFEFEILSIKRRRTV